MKFERLGRSGLTVSRICLGTMMFGGRTDEETSARIIADAAENGVNFIDTADVYNDGASERIVGKAIAGNRDDWILATKAGNRMGNRPSHQGLGRKWLLQACTDSLKRLGTDYIDIYYLHLEDLATPLEETVLAVRSLMEAGKIRYFGVSNFRAWRIAEVSRLCDGYGMPRPVVCQPYYNALNRMPEVEVLPACSHYGLGVVPYSPLARGVLTAKYDPDQPPPEESRAGAKDKRMMESEWRPESLEIARDIRDHAEAKGSTPGAFALAWLLNNAAVTSVLAGPRTLDQWRAYLAGLDYPFAEDDEALVNDRVPSGHPSTPGYTDPQYPIEGRATRHGA